MTWRHHRTQVLFLDSPLTWKSAAGTTSVGSSQSHWACNPSPCSIGFWRIQWSRTLGFLIAVSFLVRVRTCWVTQAKSLAHTQSVMFFSLVYSVNVLCSILNQSPPLDSRCPTAPQSIFYMYLSFLHYFSASLHEYCSGMRAPSSVSSRDCRCTCLIIPISSPGQDGEREWTW